MEKIKLKQIIEALLFTSAEPVSAQKIKKIVEIESLKDIREIILELQQEYLETNRAFQIHEVGTGYLLMTHQEFDSWLSKLAGERRKSRLSQAALETLAIVAYKQPIIRSEIEEIRGVNSDGVISQLIQKNLITIAGRADTLGRPHYFKTTRNFLNYFGLKELEDLPSMEEIEKVLQTRAMENQMNLFPAPEQETTVPADTSEIIPMSDDDDEDEAE